MSTSTEETVSQPQSQGSALRRLKASVSRIGTRRRRGSVGVIQESSSSLVERGGEKNVDLEDVVADASVAKVQGQQHYETWQMDPVLETFSERLRDVLQVQGVVLKAQKSLKAAERMTKALKEQSSASLEIARQDFSVNMNGKRKTVHEGPLSLKSAASVSEDRTIIDSIKGDVACGTLESLESAINSIRQQSEARGTCDFQAELDSIRADITHKIINMLSESKVGSTYDDFRRIGAVLGSLATPRAELEYLLGHYASAIRYKISSDVVSLSVSDTMQFVQDDSTVQSPSRLSNDIGFALTTALLEAKSDVEELVKRSSSPYLISIFNHWVLEQVRETCDVLLRLVILPMATPKGTHDVSECLSLFQAHCMVMENFLDLRVQNAVVSILGPTLDTVIGKITDDQCEKISEMVRMCDREAAQMDSVYRSVVDSSESILAGIRSHEYILAHLLSGTLLTMANKFAKSTVNALAQARTGTSFKVDEASLAADMLGAAGH